MSATVTDVSMADRIRAIVLPHLRFLESETELSAEDNLSELGLDSLASINLLFDLETEFGAEISDDLITESSFLSLAEITGMMESVVAGS